MREPTKEEMIAGIAKGFKDYLNEGRNSTFALMGGVHLQRLTASAIKEAVKESIKEGTSVPKE